MHKPNISTESEKYQVAKRNTYSLFAKIIENNINPSLALNDRIFQIMKIIKNNICPTLSLKNTLKIHNDQKNNRPIFNLIMHNNIIPLFSTEFKCGCQIFNSSCGRLYQKIQQNNCDSCKRFTVCIGCNDDDVGLINGYCISCLICKCGRRKKPEQITCTICHDLCECGERKKTGYKCALCSFNISCFYGFHEEYLTNDTVYDGFNVYYGELLLTVCFGCNMLYDVNESHEHDVCIAEGHRMGKKIKISIPPFDGIFVE